MNVVLFEPDIPWNTGNIGRTCVGTRSVLHLVGRLGFSLKDKFLKRAGLDYWKDLELETYPNWDAFLKKVSPDPASLFFFEKDADLDFWDARFPEDGFLIFGSETRGFPAGIVGEYRDHFYKIPMLGPIRSLNLSTAVGVALYEALRQAQKKVFT